MVLEWLRSKTRRGGNDKDDESVSGGSRRQEQSVREQSSSTTTSEGDAKEKRRRQEAAVIQAYRKYSFSPMQKSMPTRFKSYYEVLQVEKSASAVEIRRAYRRRARELHPDKSGNNELLDEFRQLQRAYDVLGDDNLRPIYDRFGTEGVELCADLGEKRKRWLASMCRRKWLSITIFTIFVIASGLLTCCFCCYCCCCCFCASLRDDKRHGPSNVSEDSQTDAQPNHPMRSLSSEEMKVNLETAEGTMTKDTCDESIGRKKRQQRRESRKQQTHGCSEYTTTKFTRTKKSGGNVVSSCFICSSRQMGNADVLIVSGLSVGSPL